MFHGHAVDAEENKDEIVQYFREVDRNLRKILHDETAPLVLAGVDFLLPLYKNAAAYTHLLDDGIFGNPEDRRAEDLHAAAWKIVQSHFMKTRKRPQPAIIAMPAPDSRSLTCVRLFRPPGTPG